MASPSQASRPDAPDTATLIAMAVLAGIVSVVLHEGLGHGGACLLSGGHNRVISSVNEDCTVSNNWIQAAGTLVNLAAGGVCLFWARRVRQSAHGRFLLWACMAFNLLAAAGYWLFSGIGNLGDWAVILEGHHPAWLWHAGMVLIGGAVYVGFVALVARELRPFLPSGGTRVARAQRLMLVPYFAYGIVNCVAAVFNPVGAVLILESAAAASFGGASGLCWGWQFVRNQGGNPAVPQMPPLTRSWGWIGAAVVVGVAYIAVLGPGLRP